MYVEATPGTKVAVVKPIVHHPADLPHIRGRRRRIRIRPPQRLNLVRLIQAGR